MKCICCEKDITSLHETSLHEDLLDGAVTAIVYCGYGSRYDLTKIEVCLCDSCLTEKIGKGVVVQKGSYNPFSRQ